MFITFSVFALLFIFLFFYFFFNRYMWILALTGKLCSVVFFFSAWWFYIPPKDIENEENVKDNSSNGMASGISIVDSSGIVPMSS